MTVQNKNNFPRGKFGIHVDCQIMVAKIFDILYTEGRDGRIDGLIISLALIHC